MAVFLNNLDDYIAPSQACVNPFFSGPSTSSTNNSSGGAARISLQSDLSTTEFEIAETPQLPSPNLIRTRNVGAGQKVASVSLNDCLACSGCVTSAETVLIQEQSSDKLMARLAKRQGIIVVAISPQSRASIAHALGMPSKEAFLRIAAVLKANGVTYVGDTACAGDIALIEAREEFMARYRHRELSPQLDHQIIWQAPTVTTAASATRVNRMKMRYSSESDLARTDNFDVESVGPVSANMLSQSLPMLVSSCPGWVCYAEKTQPQSIGFMSSTKSAQQIFGVIVKKVLFPPREDVEINFTPTEDSAPFVVSVQPCFDKKLEASRLDFSHDDLGSAREVDLVLSTTELMTLLESLLCVEGDKNHHDSASLTMTASIESSSAVSVSGAMVREKKSVSELLARIHPDSPHGRDSIEALLRRFSADGSRLVAASDSNGGSGGFLDYVFRYAAHELCGANLWGNECGRPALDWQTGRNVDMAEVELTSEAMEVSSSDVKLNHSPRRLRFAKVYGFRNIQSVLLKLKRGKCDLDFVEIMACPSGCVNGGGQLKTAHSVTENGSSDKESPTEIRARVAAVECEYHSSTDVARPDNSPLAQFVYDKLGSPFSARSLELFHTRYHAVPKLEMLAPLAAAAKW